MVIAALILEVVARTCGVAESEVRDTSIRSRHVSLARALWWAALKAERPSLSWRSVARYTIQSASAFGVRRAALKVASDPLLAEIRAAVVSPRTR